MHSPLNSYLYTLDIGLYTIIIIIIIILVSCLLHIYVLLCQLSLDGFCKHLYKCISLDLIKCFGEIYGNYKHRLFFLFLLKYIGCLANFLFFVNPACTSLPCSNCLMLCSTLVFRIPMKSLYVTLVNAFGRISLIVGFVFFSTITVLDRAHESGLISCYIEILFNAHVKTCVHCSSVPNIYKISGFIPSGPGDFFILILCICCFTSCTVISGSSMYPVILTLPALSKCSCKIVDMCVFSSGNCASASIL